MKPIWIAFFAGLFIGANLGIFLICLFRTGADYDRHLPDIEDVQARPPRLSDRQARNLPARASQWQAGDGQESG